MTSETKPTVEQVDKDIAAKFISRSDGDFAELSELFAHHRTTAATTARNDALEEARQIIEELMLHPECANEPVAILGIAGTRIEALKSQPAPEDAQGWQDISTAPKDGTKFDAWVPDAFGGHRMTGLSFNSRGKLRHHGLLTEADLPRWPTHFRPLPSPPEGPDA